MRPGKVVHLAAPPQTLHHCRLHLRRGLGTGEVPERRLLRFHHTNRNGALSARYRFAVAFLANNSELLVEQWGRRTAEACV